MINFVKDVRLPNKTANILGLTTEETIMNIREVNQKPFSVDVLCKIYPDEILINFRDKGVPFDVTKPNKESYDGITVQLQ